MTAVTTGTDEKNVTEKPSRTAARRAARADAPGTKAAAELAASGALDGLFEQIDAGELELTGDGGFIPALIKTALERGLAVELTDHLGYEKGDPDAAAFPNSRNGSTPKTVATQVGEVDLEVPRDREGSPAGRRDAGHRPLRQGVARHLQAGLRVPPAAGLRRPRPARHRGAAGRDAAYRVRVGLRGWPTTSPSWTRRWPSSRPMSEPGCWSAPTPAPRRGVLRHVSEVGLTYSVGFAAHETIKTALETIPAQAWRAALDGDGNPREGAQVAELTSWIPATSAPAPPRTGRRGCGSSPAGNVPIPEPSCG